MAEKDRPSIDRFRQNAGASKHGTGGDFFLEAIDFTGLFTKDVTSSGSFDLRTFSSTSLGKLLEALPIPVLLIDRSGCVAFTNRSFGKIGTARKEILGNPFSALFPSPSAANEAQSVLDDVFETRKGRVWEAVIDVEAGKISTRMHFRCIRTGTNRWLLVLIEDLTPEQQELLLHRLREEELLRALTELENRLYERSDALDKISKQLLKEIADREKAEDRIQAELQFVDTVLDSLSHPFYIIDADDYTVKKANSAAISAGITENSTCYSVAHRGASPCEGLDHPCPVREVKRSGGPVTIEHVHYDNKGNAKHFDVHAHPIFDSAGRVRQVIEYCLDVTDRKRTEEILLRSERLKAIGELASGVAHNFNNLLQIVLGSAQLALARLESGTYSSVQKDLQQIVESAYLGSRTVKRLQDFARIRSEIGPMAGEVFDISDTIQGAVQMCRPWWKTRPEKEGIKISVETQLRSGCFVQGHEAEIFDVMINLMKNAAEALPKGGLIKIRSEVKGRSVIVRVQDNGVGISMHDIGKVFAPFQTTKGLQASGMGLACSLGIVKRHLGDMVFESTEGQGSIFTVKLPFARKPSNKAKDYFEPGEIPPLTILIADDTEEVITVLRDGLTEFGQTVLTATSGREAVEVFQQGGTDLVICDLGMPGMNGWQVAAAVKNICHEKGVAKTPFVLITGWNDQAAEKEKLIENGVDAVLEKPIDLYRLLEVIHQVEHARRNDR